MAAFCSRSERNRQRPPGYVRASLEKTDPAPGSAGIARHLSPCAFWHFQSTRKASRLSPGDDKPRVPYNATRPRANWIFFKGAIREICWCLHREVILKVRRTIFLHGATMQAATHSSFLTWTKVVFRDGRRLAHLLGRVVRLLRHGARRAAERAPCPGITESPDASSGLPGPPADGRGKDGRVHNDKLRHSSGAQREVESLCLYICCHHFLHISILCWRA